VKIDASPFPLFFVSVYQGFVEIPAVVADVGQSIAAGLYMGATQQPWEPTWLSQTAQAAAQADAHGGGDAVMQLEFAHWNSFTPWGQQANLYNAGNSLVHGNPKPVGNMVGQALFLGALAEADAAVAGGEVVSGDNCFPAGTVIAAEHGPVTIESLRPGEQVWAYDFESGQWQLCPVRGRFERVYDGDLVTVCVSGGKVESTGDHPFWVLEGEALGTRPRPQHVAPDEIHNRTTTGRWVDARDLRTGDRLLLRSGEKVCVHGLEVRLDRLLVYNIHVADLQTYAVGPAQVLVHNRPPGGEPTRPSGRPTQIAPPGALPEADPPANAPRPVAPKPAPPPPPKPLGGG
jgi:hypothetical protein